MQERSAPFWLGLSPRKREILLRVIDTYVREVHPVSSAAVAQEIKVSSATVRNELAALEEQGFLLQPHTSGGRVPTELAYRFLVEELVDRLSSTLEQRGRVAGVYNQLSLETEALLEGTLDLLAQMTGFVAWFSLPAPAALEIKSLSFVEVDTREMLVVLVTGNGALQSRLVQTTVPVKELGLGELAEKLNNYLRARSILEVDYGELRMLFHEVAGAPASLVTALQDFFSGLAASGERVVFSDALRLVLQPEFTDIDSLMPVLNTLQDRERFSRTLRQQLDLSRLQTIIGRENINPDLKDCALVVSRYDIPALGTGTLGVLGPMRQDYSRTLSWVKTIGEAVARALSEISGEAQRG